MMNMLKLVHDQQWFADGCVAAVSTGHQGSDDQLPDVEAFAAPRKCDRVPVRVQSAWNGQGCAPNIAACPGQHSFRTRAGVQTIRPITLGSRGSGQPANTPKSNTRVHQSGHFRPFPAPVKGLWSMTAHFPSSPLAWRSLAHAGSEPESSLTLVPLTDAGWPATLNRRPAARPVCPMRRGWHTGAGLVITAWWCSPQCRALSTGTYLRFTCSSKNSVVLIRNSQCCWVMLNAVQWCPVWSNAVYGGAR
jgi:hypothetical protein